jgi:preprotein translocase subunit SecB
MEQNANVAEGQAVDTENAAPVFSIEKTYVRDLSIEVPHAPEIFLAQEPPEVSIELNTRARFLGEGAYEAVLTVTVSAKHEDNQYFLVEVSQAGVFRILNVPAEQVEPLLAVACPNILFPFAREVVSDAVSRAGFSPIILQPVNFEAMYANRLEQVATEGTLQ